MTDQDAAARFTAVYDQTRARVYAFAVSHAGRDLADEIVSEVYLVAWRRLADIPRPELPWLLAVARKVAASQLRAAARQRSIAAELRAWTTAAELATGDIADQIDERYSVLTALASLTISDRDVLTLVAWHGLTAAQAAQVMGCSMAAYFVRLHRARRRLERAMNEQARRAAPSHPAGVRRATVEEGTR